MCTECNSVLNTMEAAVVDQCRLCLGHDSFHLNIFHEDLHHKKLLMKIRTCLPVKIEHGDGLPCSICYKCVSQLEQSFDLWNNSFNSEAILRHNLVRGRVSPVLKYASTFKGTAVSNTEYNSSDYDTYFIETSEPQDNYLMGNEVIKEPISGRMKENIKSVSDESNFSETHEYPSINYMRNSSHVKETPNITNKILSEHGLVMYNDNSEKKTYSAMNQPILKETELNSIERVHKGQNSYIRRTGTLWMDNKDFSDEESNVTNKYIHKNLFGEDVIKMYGKLRKPQKNAKRTADLHAINNEKDDISRKNKIQMPWENIHKTSEVESETSPETGCISDSFTKRKRAVSKPKENHNIGGLLFDPNHCPKCNMTLTPSQNLLAHFQSHIQDD